MEKPPIRIALIPAYRPEPALLNLLQHACKAGFEVIVVDDGGGEIYTEIFEQAAEYAVVLTHPENRGKGRALKTGLEYILKHYPSPYSVVTMDADGQHRVEDAIRLCEAVEHHPDTLMLGSRLLQKEVPLRSRIGNTITRYVYSFTTGLSIHDTQTGLRAFGNALLPYLLGIPGERYEYEMDVLLECARSRVPVEEVEIPTIYFDNNSGSHFNTWKDSCRIYREIIKFSASSLSCFVLDYGLYSLLTMLALSTFAANIVARVFSSGVNYWMNCRLVFRSKNGWRSAIKYFALVAVILAGNTLVLDALIEQVNMNPYAAKLITEVLFFLLSWLVQRYFIFRRRK